MGKASKSRLHVQRFPFFPFSFHLHLLIWSSFYMRSYKKDWEKKHSLKLLIKQYKLCLQTFTFS